MTPAAQTRLLVVDDEPTNVEIVAELFEDESEVLFATCGDKALELAASGQPDLILLDVVMPGMDGYEVCRRLKADPATAAIPVIFITALSDEADETKGFALGAVDYIAKPFSPAIVRARVRTQMELAHSRRTIEATSAQRREMLHVLCHDLANPIGGIVALLDVVQSLEDFIEYKPYLVQAAQSGMEIIDMVRSMQALETGKYPVGPVKLADAVAQSVQMLQMRFSGKNVRLDVRVDPLAVVMAETTSLVNSVLNNLLTNAAKFSNPGDAVSIVTAPAPDGQLALTVADRGIGMPPEIRDSLFDLHKSTSRPGTAGEVGTGFGMPLVKRFMRAYGGQIDVQSSADPATHGTQIRLTFRLAPPESQS